MCQISVYCTIFLSCDSTSFFLKENLSTKRNYTSPLLNYVRGNASGFGFAIWVLPSDILEYFRSFFVTAAVLVSIYILIL